MNISSIYGSARRNGGTIEIESATGFDTCNEFAVPIRQKTSTATTSTPPAVNLKRSLRVLCIDDDPWIREFMTDFLTHLDHRVMAAPGGKQGLELFRSAVQENQPYEIVITDLGMPVIDGCQVAQMIKAESPQTPVILMTGWGAMIKERGGETEAVDMVVSKPLRIAELNDLLLQMTTQKS